jgi:glycerol dehydrogenase-like iron-containing ADH family enzyme
MPACIAGREAMTTTKRRTSVSVIQSVLRGLAFRLGLATNLHDLGIPDKTIQVILRRAKVAVTQNSYIKTLDSQSIAAMRQLESLVDVSCSSCAR